MHWTDIPKDIGVVQHGCLYRDNYLVPVFSSAVAQNAYGRNHRSCRLVLFPKKYRKIHKWETPTVHSNLSPVSIQGCQGLRLIKPKMGLAVGHSCARQKPDVRLKIRTSVQHLHDLRSSSVSPFAFFRFLWNIYVTFYLKYRNASVLFMCAALKRALEGFGHQLLNRSATAKHIILSALCNPQNFQRGKRK